MASVYLDDDPSHGPACADFVEASYGSDGLAIYLAGPSCPGVTYDITADDGTTSWHFVVRGDHSNPLVLPLEGRSTAETVLLDGVSSVGARVFDTATGVIGCSDPDPDTACGQQWR